MTGRIRFKPVKKEWSSGRLLTFFATIAVKVGAGAEAVEADGRVEDLEAGAVVGARVGVARVARSPWHGKQLDDDSLAGARWCAGPRSMQPTSTGTSEGGLALLLVDVAVVGVAAVAAQAAALLDAATLAQSARFALSVGRSCVRRSIEGGVSGTGQRERLTRQRQHEDGHGDGDAAATHRRHVARH